MVDNKEIIKKQAVDEFRQYYSGGVLNRIVQNKIIDKYKSLGLTEDELDVIRIKASFEAKGQQYKEPSNDEIYEMQRRLKTRSNISGNSNNKEDNRMGFFDRFKRNAEDEEENRKVDEALDEAIRLKELARQRKKAAERKELEDTIVREGLEEGLIEPIRFKEKGVISNAAERLRGESLTDEQKAARNLVREFKKSEDNIQKQKEDEIESWGKDIDKQASQMRKDEKKISKSFSRANVICPHCHMANDKGNKYCIHCGEKIRSIRNALIANTDIVGSNIRKRILEVLILLGAGALVFILTGGYLAYLGAALMIYAFLVFMPSERDVLKKVKAGEYLELGEHMGPLFARAFIKFIFYFLVILQCFVIGQPVAALIVTFIAYFQMPTYYKTSKPYQAIEAWVRMGFGILLAIEMYSTFTAQPLTSAIFYIFSLGIFSGFADPAAALFFLTAAFFITVPKKIEDEDSRKIYVGVNVGKVGKAINFASGQYQSTLGNAVFLIIALVAGLPIITQWGLWSAFLTVYIIVWIMSLVSGWFAGSEGRPFVGIIVIIFSLLAFSASFTGVVGQSIFGVWWPQVASFGESIMAPIGPMMDQLQKGVSDSWLMFTDPMGYYNKLQASSQATSSSVTEGGSIKSIELVSTEIFTSIPGQFDPIQESLIGSIMVENQGEFNANRISLKLWASWEDPTKISATRDNPPVTTGKLSRPINCHSATTSTENSCEWSQTVYPNEIKLVDFAYSSASQDEWAWSLGFGENLAKCEPSNCQDENATYVYGGQAVKINVNLTYDYNVNVSLPIEVIDNDRYMDLLQRKELSLHELTSQYTGGPVKATLWSQRQPIRSGETSMFVASIVNEGNGMLDQIRYFTVLIPADLVGDYDGKNGINTDDIEIVAKTFETCTVHDKDEMPLIVEGNEYYGINCVNTDPFKSGEFKRVSFYIKPTEVTVSKTFQIIGIANYEYTKTGSSSITVASVPWH